MTIMARNITHLNIGTFNCQGAMRCAPYISSLLTDNNLDVLILNEHWLFPNSLHFLDSVQPGYIAYAIADDDLSGDKPLKRGKGGVAILWKVELSGIVSKNETNSDRIISVSFELEHK